MTWVGGLELGLVIVLGTAGQISLKSALVSAKGHRSRHSLPVKLSLIVWMSCYAVTTVLWLVALRSIPLSQAFPILGLQYAFIPLVSARLLNERMAELQWIGIILILVGVALVGGS